MEIKEYQVELDAGFKAQEYCRALFGASRGRHNWRDFHDSFVAGYKEAQHGWQPIETAPKCKALLLAAEMDGPEDWRIKCGSFYDDDWHVWGASWTPTHWMPLPVPPSNA
jgi:hypothetical protein